MRLVAESRGSIEKERFHRLYRLQEAVEFYQGLSPEDKQEVVKALHKAPLPKDDTSKLLESDISEGLEEMSSTEGTLEVLSPELDIPQLRSSYLPLAPHKLAAHFRALYVSHKASVAKSVWIDRTAVAPEQTPTERPTVAAEDKQNSVTKNQHNLAVQEEILWRKIDNSLTSQTLIPDLGQTATNLLNGLVRRSHVLFSSFDRRVNKPGRIVYDESKEILQAMGIPCVDATGAVEAEGLASAMVLEGYADYVGSEDTVRYCMYYFGPPLIFYSWIYRMSWFTEFLC